MSLSHKVAVQVDVITFRVSSFKLTKRARLTHCSTLGRLMGLFPSKKLSQVGYQSFFLS